jgi:hypothetical protein
MYLNTLFSMPLIVEITVQEGETKRNEGSLIKKPEPSKEPADRKLFLFQISSQ